MRISSKILLAFLLLIIMITTISFVYVKSTIDIVPTGSINGRVARNIFPENFTSIEVKRGAWLVNVIQSDSFFVTVEAGDNLVNNYLNISVMDSTLILDIDSAIINDEYRFLKVTVEMPSIKMLEVDSNDLYFLRGFDEKMMEIGIQSGIVYLDSCHVEKLNVKTSGYGKLFMQKSSAGELSYTVKDSAFIVAEGVEKISCARIEDLGVLIHQLNRDEIKIFTSEGRKNLTNQMTTYVDNLKWLMPLDTVLQIMDRDSLNFKHKDEHRKNLFEYLSEALVVTYHNNSGKNQGIELKQLIFSRGLLTDINVRYYPYGELKLIHDELEKSFNAQYGTTYKWKPPSYFGVNTGTISEEYWRAPEQNVNGKYTTIQLHYNNSNWLSLQYSSPINSLWNSTRSRISWEMEKFLSKLRSFPNIVELFIQYFNTPARQPHKNNN